MNRPIQAFVFFLFFLNFQPARCSEKISREDKTIAVFTMPKSGTHLIKKLIHEITDLPISSRPALFFQLFGPDDRYAFIQHVFTAYNFLRNDTSNRYIKLLLIRDPRDIIISKVFWLQKNQHWFKDDLKKSIHQIISLPVEEQITAVINFPDEYFSTHYFAKNAYAWMKDPSVYVCRFEDLVGSHGGGDDDAQAKAIRSLASHIGYSLTDQEIADITGELFGETITFRKGQIGTWREYFTPEHKEMCKKVLGQDLINLGYEKDFNW